ncbi:MAG: hypothetical protein GY812_02655 [Actinomycetia bacterium]|nr:hypothetical protein [Actinomycetes bacterium]
MADRRRSMAGSTRCSDVSGRLAGVAAGEQQLSAHERAHVEQCLRCQAEVVQHRRILRSMRQMRHEVIEPAPGMLADLLGEFHEAAQSRAVRSLVRRRPVAYVAALSALGVGAAVGIVITARHRRGQGERPTTAVVDSPRVG